MTVQIKRRARALCALALSTVMGCGYSQSGTWEDDPNNYRRAWGTDPPESLTVVHSWYQRMPHFTREEIYFFHIANSPGFAETFAQTNEMQRAKAELLEDFWFCAARPGWFAPGDPRQYRAWVERSGSVLAMEDKLAGDSFVYVCWL